MQLSAAALERGAEFTGDFRCRSCGYGIAKEPPFPECPMCARRDWIPGRTDATAGGIALALVSTESEE